MNILKSGACMAATEAEGSAMEKINRFARSPLSAEEVYTFTVKLCDNEIDRDFERFDEGTLGELAELFVGRTGISDHDWSSGKQVARIYEAELVREAGRKCSDGRDYVWVKAGAYMLRTEENAGLIVEIEGGIKQETSVGCAVRESRCSICGREYGSGDCGHRKGQEYGGRVCHAILSGAADAYEWSFVAVPAQRSAGVTKVFGGSCCEPEAEALMELGRAYLGELRAEVKRLGLICDRGLYKGLGGAIERMEAPELREMRAALEKRAAEKLPLAVQIKSAAGGAEKFDGSEYAV